MKQCIIFTVTIMLSYACTEKLIEKPGNLIPQDKMVLILKEMAIINAAKGTNLGKLRDNGIDPTTFVFEKYAIDSAQFVESDRYYASLPEVYETMYKEVESNLENQRLALEAAKKLKDSLALVKKSSRKDIDRALKDTSLTIIAPQ